MINHFILAQLIKRTTHHEVLLFYRVKLLGLFLRFYNINIELQVMPSIKMTPMRQSEILRKWMNWSFDEKCVRIGYGLQWTITRSFIDKVARASFRQSSDPRDDFSPPRSIIASSREFQLRVSHILESEGYIIFLFFPSYFYAYFLFCYLSRWCNNDLWSCRRWNAVRHNHTAKRDGM